MMGTVRTNCFRVTLDHFKWPTKALASPIPSHVSWLICRQSFLSPHPERMKNGFAMIVTSIKFVLGVHRNGVKVHVLPQDIGCDPLFRTPYM